jgi:hypothetical protein
MRYLGIAATLLALVSSTAIAANQPGPLTGVKEVGVLVYLQHDAATSGLDKAALQAKAEQDLKAAGINVLKYGVKAKYAGPGVLVLTIDIVKWTGHPINAINVRGDFMERAAVDRAGKPFVEDGSTWQYANTGLGGDLELKDQIGELVDQTATLFGKEYIGDNKKVVK